MSCNFMSCGLIRHFHVRHFQSIIIFWFANLKSCFFSQSPVVNCNTTSVAVEVGYSSTTDWQIMHQTAKSELGVGLEKNHCS